MTYTFGHHSNFETLNTKSNKAKNLVGFHTLIRETDVDTTIDRFRVVHKMSEQTDAEGNVYEKYEITDHYREVDKTPPLNRRIAAAEAAEAVLEDALCEEDMAAEQRIAEIENALCELDERSA